MGRHSHFELINTITDSLEHLSLLPVPATLEVAKDTGVYCNVKTMCWPSGNPAGRTIARVVLGTVVERPPIFTWGHQMYVMCRKC